MTTKLSHFKRFAPLYLLGAADALVLFIARAFVSPHNFDWPAWVQAVGSISAILVAVWVSSDQATQQRLRDDDRDRAEISGVLQSLKAEVETSLAYLEREVLPVLNHIEVGNPIRYTFGLPEYPFPIFDRLIPKLGVISDARLQRDIIHTYAAAKSLAITAQVHNTLAEELDEIEVRYRANSPRAADGEFAGALRGLTMYGHTLRAAFNPTIVEMRALLGTLSNACPDV